MTPSRSRNLYIVSSSTRFKRWALRATFRHIFRILCEINIVGIENIPKDGAYIIAYNHISLFEPPFILTFWPIPPEALGGADVFDRPGQKIMVRAYGTIPVQRGQYNRKVIEIMLDLLEQGKPLLIAPEGGRSHTPGLQRALPGVAYLMDQTKVPVLPVGIVGSTRDLLKRAFRAERPRLEMRIGEKFELPPITGKGKTRRQSRQTNADLVMRHIADLLPEDYHGVYADPQSLSPTD